jgi:hypothetical protein
MKRLLNHTSGFANLAPVSMTTVLLEVPVRLDVRSLRPDYTAR